MRVVLLGDMGRFAVDVGEQAGHKLRRVDLWAAGQWLTCDDNVVYVPQFRHEVARTADWVRSGRAEPLPFKDLSSQDTHRQLLDRISNLEDDYFQFRPFDRWGPTTDNVLSFVFRDGDRLVLTFEFWREQHLRAHPGHVGMVLTAETGKEELTAILDQLASVLAQDDSSS